MTTDPADRTTGASAVPQVPTAFINNYGPTVADRRHRSANMLRTNSKLLGAACQPGDCIPADMNLDSCLLE